MDEVSEPTVVGKLIPALAVFASGGQLDFSSTNDAVDFDSAVASDLEELIEGLDEVALLVGTDGHLLPAELLVPAPANDSEQIEDSEPDALALAAATGSDEMSISDDISLPADATAITFGRERDRSMRVMLRQLRDSELAKLAIDDSAGSLRVKFTGPLAPSHGQS